MTSFECKMTNFECKMKDYNLGYLNVGAGRSPNFAKKVETLWTSRWKWVYFVNIMVAIWYFRHRFTDSCIGLQHRFIFLWQPTSTITLYAEHKSSEYPYNSNEFLKHAALNSLHYLAGFAILKFDLPHVFGVPLMAVALCGYIKLCYDRYHISDTKLHKYSVIFEIIITVFILPMFLMTDIYMKNPEKKQFYWPYAMTDIVLKVARTFFLSHFKDAFYDDPRFVPYMRQESWARPVAKRSILSISDLWLSGPDKSN